MVALLASSGSASALPGSLPRGDVNKDGRFDGADALVLFRYLRGDAAVVLDAESLWAADVGPVVSGTSTPDSKVDLGDLVVLFRLANGELGTAAPTLGDLLPGQTSTNPMTGSISGTGPTGATIHLFVRNSTGAVVHVDTSTATDGAFSFPSPPMLFEGNNEFFVVAVLNGLASRPSSTLEASWASSPSTTCNPITPPTATIVWTAHCGDYVIPNNGLTVSASTRLILGPGVVLRFNDSDDSLTVAGTLQAFGAGSQMVHLTSKTPSSFWQGIDFTSTSGTNSFLSYAHVDRVGNGSTAVEITAGASLVAVAIRHSVIDVTGGLRGIKAIENARLTLEWTDVFGNRNTAGSTGVQLGVFQLAGISQTAVISHSRIFEFRTCVSSNFSSSGVPHNVSYTEIHSCDTGVNLKSARANMFPGNSIHDNDVGIQLSTSGIGDLGSCWPTAGMGEVRDSTLENNDFHVRANQGSWKCAGFGAPPDAARAVFDARDNYWGTTNPSDIAAKIDDFTDHIALSPSGSGMLRDDQGGLLVDFTPFRMTVGGPLEYQYIAGRLDQEFGPSVPVLPVRKAVGPLLLDKTKTATIPAGTTIETFLDPNTTDPVPVDILISGTLRVQGTAQDPVEFVSPGRPPQLPKPGEWWGIQFDTNSKDSELDHVRILHSVEAVRATQTNVSIDGATIGQFTAAGIVFDRVDDGSAVPLIPSEVVNSILDGTIDPGPPPVTVKSGAVRQVVGIRIIDSFRLCGTAACLGSISGNMIQNLVTGIHVLGASDPQILDNEISDNIWGIWLQALPSGEPNPPIHLNRIHDNQGTAPVPPAELQETLGFRSCANFGANLCLSDYGTTGAATTVIDASQNYWGALTPEGVRSSVLITKGKRVAVDLSEFKDAAGNIVGPADLLSAIIVGIGAQGAALQGGPVIRPTVVSGEHLEITYSLQRAADVVIEFFRESDDTSTATPLRILTVDNQAPGAPYTSVWDGKNTSNNWVPDGAYVYVITAKDPTTGSIIDRYDPPRNLNVPGEGFTLLGDRGNGVPDANALHAFNSFVNDYLTYQYTLANYPPLGPFSSRVTARVRQRPGNEACNLDGVGIGKVVATPWREKPLWIGAHTFLWDGRADDTVDQTTGIVPGELIAEVVQTASPDFDYADFCLFFEAPEPLKPNHVIVAKTLPTITGTGLAPEIEVKSNPFLIQPSYEQSSALTFKVDQAAVVTLYILEPGETNIGPVPDSIAMAVPAGIPITYYWKGHPDTAGNSNLLKAAFDGPYTFALKAVSAQDSTLYSIYRGVIHIRGEGEER